MNILKPVAAGLLLASACPQSISALPTDFFAPKSVLSEKNWVKISVKETGLYEISFSELRNMGFANPEKVCVYGNGGLQMSPDFVDRDGNRLTPDDLSEIPALRKGDKLFFYAEGIDLRQFVKDRTNATNGYFVNKGLNIYSNYGYYFLCEGSNPKEMENGDTYSSGNAPSIELTSGIGAVIHEKDLYQNNSNSGQLFWGESFNNGNPGRQEWTVYLPDLDTTEGTVPNGRMHCEFYTEKGESYKTNLKYGVEGADNIADFETRSYSDLNFRAQEQKEVTFNYPATSTGNVKVFIDLDNSRIPTGVANLDYWTLNYLRRIPTLKGEGTALLNQDVIAFPSVTSSTEAMFSLTDPYSRCVIDITDPKNPKNLPVTAIGKEGKVIVKGTESPVLLVFDPSRAQKQIAGFETGWDRIENQNLHGLQTEGADFLIITLPFLKEKAEEIAEIHRSLDGMKVVVATAQEIYNEFSGGMPDPQAYRLFIKMLYESKGRQLKNVMLMGPIVGDVRGMNIERDPLKTLIAYQQAETSVEKGALNINSFLCMMSDRMLDETGKMKPLENTNIEIGLGLLPVYNTAEADKYIAKLERYLDRTDHAMTLNRQLSSGGTRDKHTHDNQAIEISRHFNSISNNSIIPTIIAVDAYGYDTANKKFIETINKGVGYANYFGHGGNTSINDSFFRTKDIQNLTNTQTPFMNFAACEVSNTDRGIRGLGEALVVDTPYGLIGSMLATRATWSGQNQEFIRYFYNSLGHSNPKSSVLTPLQEPLTIGQVYSTAVTSSMYVNALAYMVIGDPAVIIPTVLRNVSPTTGAVSGNRTALEPGSRIELEGNILDTKGNVDKTFNGDIVVRLLEPEIILRSQDFVTQEQIELLVPYGDSQMSIARAEVKNGHYKVRLNVPAYSEKFEGQTARIVYCAYNPERRFGAACEEKITIGSSSSTGSGSQGSVKDTTAPVIETLSFNPEDKILTVTVSDDYAIDTRMGGITDSFHLFIDGRIYRAGDHAEFIPEIGREAYTKKIGIHNIQQGTHSARVEVIDCAGNKQTGELVFNYEPLEGKYMLSLIGDVVTESGEFEISGGQIPSEAELRIMTLDGKVIFSGAMTNGSMVWNRRDNSGNRVAAGHYKAFVIEKGSKTDKGHSRAIDVNVI